MNLANGGFVYIYDSNTGNERRSFVFIVSRDKSERGNRKCGPPNKTKHLKNSSTVCTNSKLSRSLVNIEQNYKWVTKENLYNGTTE